MNRSLLTNTLLATIALLAIMALPSLVMAQTERPRSDTGRRRAPAKVEAPQVEKKPDAQWEQGPWFVGLGAGVAGSGDLWHVETVSGAPALSSWDSIMPFISARFNATLGNNFDFTLFAGRHLGPMVSVRADFQTSRMDIGAEALQGQQAAVFLYDRMTMSSLALSLETRLVQQASYPFANAGLIVDRLSFGRAAELDQTQLGFKLGLGYMKALNPKFNLRAEANYSHIALDTDDFLPQTIGFSQPEVVFDPAESLNFLTITLAVQMNL